MNETDALKRPFLIGLLGVGAVLLVLVGLLAVVADSTDDRAEGVAERWLTAVGDTTRDGVQSDAHRRVEDHGAAQLVDWLIPHGVDMKGKSAFTELEVGKAIQRDGKTVVPYHVKAREGESSSPDGVLVMVRSSDTWSVADIGPAEGAKVPSDGGEVASKAPVTLYLAALVVGAGIAVGASALVRAAGREQDALLSAV